MIRIWNVQGRCCVATLEGHGRPVTGLAALYDGMRLASTAKDRTVRVWDVESGEVLTTLVGHLSFTLCAVPLAAPLLVSGSSDRTLRVWDMEAGCELAKLE